MSMISLVVHKTKFFAVSQNTTAINKYLMDIIFVEYAAAENIS